MVFGVINHQIILHEQQAKHAVGPRHG
jgi:hypothetical protein